jgi:tape measure domain-containing protein
MAVQDAELQLKVSLDLAFFRQQLSGLGQAAAGYNVPINVKFDRRSVQNELNALGRNISQRTYRLEVATNISQEIKNAGTLAKALRGLDNAIQKNRGIANRAAAGISGGTADAGKIQTLVNKATKPALQALYSEMSKASIPMAAVGKDTVANLRNAILSGVPQLTTDLARGISNGLNPQMKESGSKGAKLFIDAWKDAAGIASPSKVFKALGEFSADGLEIGFLNGLKDFRAKAVLEIRNLVKSLQREAKVGMIAAGGMLSPIARPAGAATKTIPGVTSPRDVVSRQDPGRSYTRMLNSLSLLTGDPKLYRGRMANLGANRLPSSLLGSAATQMNLEEMVPSFKQSRLEGTKTGVANVIDEAFFGRGTLPKASSALSGLSNALERLASSARAAVPSGILQSASGSPRFRGFGGVPSSQSMGIFSPTARAATYPPSGGFLEFSRRATAISAGLPGNVFGGRSGPPGGPPSGPPLNPPRPPVGGGGGMGGFSGFGRALGGINLPGTGVVREIGNEFAMATKQVLLFGTAYKALAFITSFPAQVGQAVGALQSFNNTLKAISPTADEARASNQFILDIVDRYNVPLQSARDGFTKLYASMAPAGFKGDEIRDLFTGVSQAAATFGMSADKVDRVNYAFAQMASKGQVMSEELKGQLGDVLPGAMGIFTEAAGFKGPDAIQKFSKALEDGVYQGEAMRGLLKNVTVVLTKEFGPGAEGAARTFQGVINRMQNSTQLLYEAFEPVAVGFLNSVVVPLTSGIKTVADGFNAFFTSTQAKTAGGSAFAQELEKLKPAFEGIRANITALMPALQGFAGVLLEVGKVFLQIAANPFVGYLARVYLSVLPLVTIIKALNLQALIPMIGSLLRAVPAFLTFNSLMLQGNRAGLALKTTTFLLGSTSAVTAGQIRLVGTALLSLGMPAVLLGIGALIERFMMLKGAVDGVRQSTQQMVGSISSLANTGAVREIKNIGADTQKQMATFKSLQPFVSGGLGNAPQRRLTEDAAKKMEELGLGSFVSRGVTGPYVNDFLNASRIIEERLKGLGKTADSVKEKLPLAEKAAASLAKQAKQGIEPIPEGAGSDKKKQQSLESYYSLQDQLAKNFTQDQLDRMEKEYQARVDRINAEFNLREARANSLQKEAIRFERQMSDIELKRQKALLDASAEVIRAQGSVAGGASGGGGRGLGAGIAQYITGDPASPFYKADHGGGNYHEHLAFVSREAAEEAYRKLTSAGIQVTEFKGKSRVGRHTPGSAHYAGLAFDVPGAQVPVGQETSLTARVQSILGIGGAGAPRKVPGSEKRDIVADQKAQLAVAQQSVAVQMAEVQAIRDAAVAWAEYTNAITPIEEQKLQNSILAKKNELVKLGMPDDVIEKEMKQFETQQKTALAVDVVNKMLNEKKISAEDAAAKIAELNKNMETYNNLLSDNLALQNQQKFDASMGALRKQMELAGILDPRAELRARIAQEKTGYTPQQVEEEAALQEQIEAATKARDQLRNIASSIGDAFGTAFKSIITGSSSAREALAGMFQSIADSFADMVAKMIAEWLKAQLIQGFANIFSAIVPGIAGIGGGGLSSGFSAGAFSAIDTSAAGWGAAFNTPLKFANGGIASGGFQAFANGGIVTGPTLGLVGEGRYNEAVVPLPDGKSVPVDLGGAAGNIQSSIIINIEGNGNAKSDASGSNASDFGRKIEGAVKKVIVNELRPGGVLAGGRR